MAKAAGIIPVVWELLPLVRARIIAVYHSPEYVEPWFFDLMNTDPPRRPRWRAAAARLPFDGATGTAVSPADIPADFWRWKVPRDIAIDWDASSARSRVYARRYLTLYGVEIAAADIEAALRAHPSSANQKAWVDWAAESSPRGGDTVARWSARLARVLQDYADAPQTVRAIDADTVRARLYDLKRAP